MRCAGRFWLGALAGFGGEGLGFWSGLGIETDPYVCAAAAVIYALHRLYLYTLLCCHVTE